MTLKRTNAPVAKKTSFAPQRMQRFGGWFCFRRRGAPCRTIRSGKSGGKNAMIITRAERAIADGDERAELGQAGQPAEI